MSEKKAKIKIFVGGLYGSHHGLTFRVTEVKRDGVYWINNHGDIGRTPSFYGFRVRLAQSFEESPQEKAEKAKRRERENA